MLNSSGLNRHQLGQKGCHAPVDVVVRHQKFERRLSEGFENGFVVDLPTDLQQLYRDFVGFVLVTGHVIRGGT